MAPGTRHDVTAVWMVVRAELRTRWRSWLALVLLVAVVGGIVLGGIAAGRRTASAFPRFVERYGYDSLAYSYRPLPRLGSLPEVASAVQTMSPVNGSPHCACPHKLSELNFGILEYPRTGGGRFYKLVSGRLPDPSSPDQVLASFNFARDEGLKAGSEIRVRLYSASQTDSVIANTAAAPEGRTVSLRVVGIEASEPDFPSVGTQSYYVLTTPAFARAVNPTTAVFDAYIVRLRHGVADLPRFDADFRLIGGAGTSDLGQLKTSVIDAIHPQAVGWWVLALLAAIAGLAVVAQALSRQAGVETDTYRTLTSLGFGADDLTAVGIVRALAIGCAGAIGAVLVAFALSPLAPVGEARVAELSTGLAFDSMVLGFGALAIVLVVLLLGLWPAVRSSRPLRTDQRAVVTRSSPVVTKLAAAGAPPSMVIGVRRALEAGHGRNAIPVRSALAGAVLAVAALSGTAVFGTSLTHLTSTPALYGQAFQIWFNGFQDLTQAAPIESELRHDPAVTAVTLGLQGPVTIDGIPAHTIAGSALEGHLLISLVNGRLPANVHEVALGTKTMGQVGAHVGSTVRMSFPLSSGGSRTTSLRVVGTASFPPDFGVVGLSSGAYLTVGGFVAAQCQPGSGFGPCRQNALQSPVLLVGVIPGPAGNATVARFSQQYPGTAFLPVTPANLVNFGEAVNFPLILGFVLSLFGVATLLHVLVVSVARRRREVGLLKAIGLQRRQVAAAVCWQATTIALVGIVIGVPLGVVAGRAVWQTFATNLGVVPITVIEVWTLALLAVAVLVLALALAVGPALVSARSRPAALLRTE